MIQTFAASFSSNSEALGYIIATIIGVIFFGVLLLLLLPALTLAGLARRKAETIRNNRQGTVIAQYDPPHELSPAEVGLLYDMRCGTKEVMATIFNLQQRGIVKIIDEKTVEVIDKASYANLREFEKIAVRIYQGETDDIATPRTLTVTINNPSTGEVMTYHPTIPAKKWVHSFAAEVQNSIKQRGIPMRNFYKAFAIRVAIVFAICWLIPMATAGMETNINGVDYPAWSPEVFASAFMICILFGFVFFPIYVAASIMFVWIWTRIAGRYWLNTREARKIWPELEGYKMYLKQVDLDNIQFESANANLYAPITKSLPYAMVLELDTKWQARVTKQ